MKNFNEIIGLMREHGISVPDEKVYIKINNAKENSISILSQFCENPIWQPEYDNICEWLTSNNGKGLFLYGDCGRGKTIWGKYVIPAMLLYFHNKVVKTYSIQEMNNDIDEILKRKLIMLDDIGTEDMMVRYGEKRLAFAEIVDMAEKQSKLLIVTSNLNADELRVKYGERVIDRIKGTMHRVLFKGSSLRK